jgi:hypothetical protein
MNLPIESQRKFGRLTDAVVFSEANAGIRNGKHFRQRKTTSGSKRLPRSTRFGPQETASRKADIRRRPFKALL